MQTGQVFLSYSRADSAFALKLGEDLRKAGIDVWIDQIDIPPSHPWDEEIEKALGESATLIVILSSSSVASDNVLNEINFALETKKKVLPVLLHEGIRKPFNISRLQHIDFTGSYENALPLLIRSLESGAMPTVSSTRPPLFRKWLLIGLITLLALFAGSLFFFRSYREKAFPKFAETGLHAADTAVKVDINGRWSTPELTNPFDQFDKYHIHFDLEVIGDRLVGTINMQSTVEFKNYNFSKQFVDGSFSNNRIYFYTLEQSTDGSTLTNFKNYYFGTIAKDEILFTLKSDRPSGFPGQRFVARRPTP